jgi:hypothetical protein
MVLNDGCCRFSCRSSSSSLSSRSVFVFVARRLLCGTMGGVGKVVVTMLFLTCRSLSNETRSTILLAHFALKASKDVFLSLSSSPDGHRHLIMTLDQTTYRAILVALSRICLECLSNGTILVFCVRFLHDYLLVLDYRSRASK